jgi:hypothetical protein
MKRILTISFLLCQALFTLAQQQITGYVIDEASGDTIPRASIV